MPQNMHYWLMKQSPYQVRTMLLHPQKYLDSKKYLQRAKKLHQNWLLIRMPQNMHYCYVRQCSLFAYLILSSLYEMCLGGLHYNSLYALSLHSTLCSSLGSFSSQVRQNNRTSTCNI